jgi:hypothetical protein
MLTYRFWNLNIIQDILVKWIRQILPVSVAEEIRKHVYMNIDVFWSESSKYGDYMVWCPTGYERSQDQAIIKKSFTDSGSEKKHILYV